MKKILFLLIFINLSLTAKELKIGYFDIQQVINSSPQFIEAKQSFVKEFKPKEEELITLEKKIESLSKKFDKNKKGLSKSKIQSKAKRIADLKYELEQKVIKFQQALELKNTQELGKIENLINQSIKKVAEEQNFDLILYKEVAHASDKINITSIISKKLRDLFK